MKSSNRIAAPPTSTKDKGPAIVGKNDDIKRLQQDLVLLATRTAQSGDNVQPQSKSVSSVVSDLRTVVGEARSSSEAFPVGSVTSKPEILEIILARVADLDRMILRQTEPLPDAYVRPRRNSKTAELFSLPTHFQLIDRLVDMHTQLKRPVIVHNHDQTDVSSIKEELTRKLREEYGAELAGLRKQVEDARSQLTETYAELTASKDTVSRLNGENTALLAEIEQAKSASRAAPPVPVALSLPPDHSERLAALERTLSEQKEANTSLRGSYRVLEECTEQLQEERQKMCNALLSMAKSVSDGAIGMSNVHFVTEAASNAELNSAFQRVIKAVSEKVKLLSDSSSGSSSRITDLEDELSSMRLERQLLGEDLASVSASYTSLRVAFSEMESEMIQLRVKMDEVKKAASKNDSLDAQMLAAREANNADILRLTNALTAIENRLASMEREKDDANMQNTILGTELIKYKALTEKLKQKIRDITPMDKREFLDSFEEVMRDEMMAMKDAFETKLRLAKGEVEAMSRKHQQDILRLKDSSSTSSLKKLT